MLFSYQYVNSILMSFEIPQNFGFLINLIITHFIIEAFQLLKSYVS